VPVSKARAAHEELLRQLIFQDTDAQCWFAALIPEHVRKGSGEYRLRCVNVYVPSVQPASMRGFAYPYCRDWFQLQLFWVKVVKKTDGAMPSTSMR